MCRVASYYLSMLISVPRQWLIVSAIVAATCALYIAGMGDSFVGMDFPLYSRVLYSSTYLETAFDLLLDFKGTIVSGYYAPLSSISLMLDKIPAFSDVPNPRVTLAINTIFHCVNGLLVFALLTRLGVTFRAALLACGLFLIHPIQVPSVLWFSQRKTLMAVTWYLVAYLLYDRHREKGSLPFYYASLVAFGCALLSKPTAVVLPVILLVDEVLRRSDIQTIGLGNNTYDSDSLTRSADRSATEASNAESGSDSASLGQKAVVVRLVPFFLLAVAYGIITIGTEIPPKVNVPFYERPFIACAAVIFYIFEVLLPVDLMYVYPMWRVSPSSVGWWVPPALVVAAASVIYIVRRRVKYELWWGIAGFLIPLIPVLGLVGFGHLQHSFVADHFLYLSMVGGALCMATAIGYAFERAGGSLKYAVAVIVLVYMAALTYQTATRIAVWKDGLTLWAHNAEVCPSCYAAQDMLGLALLEAGKTAEAAKILNRVVTRWPDKCEAFHNLGAVMTKLGRPEAAVSSYRKAIVLCPDSFESYNNLGDLLSKFGKNGEAVTCYRAAIRLNPSFAEAYSNLGDELLKLGQVDEAFADFRTAIRLKPFLPTANNNMGWIEMRAGRFEKALGYFRTAIRFKPDFAEAYNGVGIAEANLGRTRQAVNAFEKAVELRPDFEDARNNLDRVRRQLK